MSSPTTAEALVPLGEWREPEPEPPPAPRASGGRSRLEAAVGVVAVFAAAALLAWTSLRDTIAFPYSDSHDWAAEVLRTEHTGDWAAYLWRPHNAQRMPWMRLAEAVQIEAAGHPPAFWLIAALLWALGIAAYLVLLARVRAVGMRPSLWLGIAGLLLLTCGPLGEDFAFSISSIYLFGAGPALAAACLWGCAGSARTLSPWRLGAIACAVIASGGGRRRPWPYGRP